MSEHSPTIESEVPTLQQFRSITETTIDQPELRNTNDKYADDVSITEGHNISEDRDDVKIPVLEATKKKYTTYDKKDVKLPSTENATNKNADFAKSPAANERGKDLTNGKGQYLAFEENAVAAKDDFVYSPVITVTKEESTLTKGDLKLQKVVVSEDISDQSTTKNSTSMTKASSTTERYDKIQSDVLPVSITTKKHIDENNAKKGTEDEAQKDPKKNQTKIPKLRWKNSGTQIVERIRKEKQEKRNKKDTEATSGQKRRSSIPKLKDMKNPQQNIQKDFVPIKKGQEIESPKVDDEFEKLYEEIIESETSNNVPTPEKIINPIKLESKFEEIIHAYDENNIQPISIEKTKSKIPLLKRNSEQEIDIPPPSYRKHSLKRSNTDDFQSEIPLAMKKEKYLKSDVETVKQKESSTNKTETATSVKAEVTSNKKLNSQRSIETKELDDTSSPKTLVKSENTSNRNVKDTTKCKIPVALNAKYSLETKINSATLNKHPTRTSVIEKISQTCTSDGIDKVKNSNVEKSQSQNIINAKSSASLLEKEKLIKQDAKHILETKDIDEKVITEKPTSQCASAQESKTSQQEGTNNQNIHSETGPCDVKAINDSKMHISNLSQDEHFHQMEIKNYKLTLENMISRADKFGSVKNDQNKILNELPPKNENENKGSLSVTSNFTIKNNVDDGNKNIEESKGDPTLISSNFDAQKLKNTNKNNKLGDKNANNFKTDFKKIDDKIHEKSKEIKIDSEKSQIINRIELTLELPKENSKEDNSNTRNISTLKNIQENNPSSQRPINVKLHPLNNCCANDSFVSNTKIYDNNQKVIVSNNQTVSEKENELNVVVNKTVSNNTHNGLDKESSQDKGKIKEDLPVKGTNIEDNHEEDIIMLKGKVNRVIRRLDSKDSKIVKKELDDVPREVSVISKIALFERRSSKDSLSKSKEDIAPLGQDLVTDDQPKVVNEILKTDINQNAINYTDEFVANVNASENTVNYEKAKIRNDLEVRKVNRTTNTRDLKTKNNLSEGTKIRRTVSSVGEHHDVFTSRDDEKSMLEVWNEYRRNKEVKSDMRRARSLAELELGEEARGRVRRLVARMSSVEPPGRGAAGPERGAATQRPQPGAVSQRIALYERKLAPVRGEAPPARQQAAPPTAGPSGYGEEEVSRRVAELQRARAQYGSVRHMQHVELSDGGRMPALWLGTANLEPALVGAVVRAAIDLGFRGIDAAYIYGNERQVGAAVRDKIRDGTVTRSELFIVNKLWSTYHRRELVEQACRQSLQAMGLDYFDLYLIHNPMSFKEGPNPLPKIAGVLQYSSHDYLEAWFGVEGLVARGLARRGGLSNFNSQQVDRVVDKARIKPVINQVECHPYLTQLRLEEFCLSRNIKLSCFGVLGSKGTPGDFTSGLPPVIDDPLVQVMAAGLGVTPAQLLISYQLQLGRGVVVKCSSAAHLAQALAVLPTPATAAAPAATAAPAAPAAAAAAPVRLQAAHVAALNSLNRNKRIFTFKGMGDTHKNYPFRIPF